MKILIISPEQNPVPPFVGGSVENCIHQIARKLASRHHVTVVSRRHGRYPNHSTSEGVTNIRVPQGAPISYLMRALKSVQGRHFDVVQIDNRPKFAPYVKRRFPHAHVSVFLHSLTFVSAPMTSRSRAARDLSSADVIVGNSRSLQSNLRSRFPQHKHKIRYVHLGVNLAQFRKPSESQRQSVRRKYGVSGSFAVVFAGRLIPRKGIPTLIKAAKLAQSAVPHIKVIIAGGTGHAGYKASLKRTAAQQKMAVKFLGYVSRTRMHEVFWMGDAMVCPSQKHEAFGLVIAEALACGTPAVASRIGGIPELIRHGSNGLLVDAYRSPSAFAKQLIALHRNKNLARRIGNQGRADMVNRFSWSSTAKRLAQIYRKR